VRRSKPAPAAAAVAAAVGLGWCSVVEPIITQIIVDLSQSLVSFHSHPPTGLHQQLYYAHDVYCMDYIFIIY